MSATPLPPDLEQFVFDQLAKGKYHSATDVVCDAVRLMRERETKLELLRAEIDRGLRDVEAGNYVELDSEESLQAFFDDIEARSQKRRSTMQAES